MRLQYASASLLMARIGTHGAIISNVYSRHRRNGEASKLMEMALEIADAEQREVMIWVQQFGDVHGLKTDELVEWYGRLGFVKLDGPSPKPMMLRPRREKNMAYSETPVYGSQSTSES